MADKKLQTISSFSAYIFDLDGVVWLGKTAIPGVTSSINALRERGKTIRFLTNNAFDHREYQLKKLKSQGLIVDLAEVFTAGSATAAHLKDTYSDSKIHVMGTSELAREMSDVGHTLVEREADFVVCGLDKEFNWDKLNLAFKNVSLDGAKIVACNTDVTYPSSEGILTGAGANLASLLGACEREADIIVGKPSKEIFDTVLRGIDAPAHDCLMIGDKLQTDILGARDVGMKTALALTGICSEKDIERLGIEPDFVINSVADLQDK